jgi:hypothetical protein
VKRREKERERRVEGREGGGGRIGSLNGYPSFSCEKQVGSFHYDLMEVRREKGGRREEGGRREGREKGGRPL